jgi:hypothetical protein
VEVRVAGRADVAGRLEWLALWLDPQLRLVRYLRAIRQRRSYNNAVASAPEIEVIVLSPAARPHVATYRAPGSMLCAEHCRTATKVDHVFAVPREGVTRLNTIH